MVNLFHTINMQKIEVYFDNCIRYAFNCGLYSHVYEPIFGMMIYKTKLHSLIPVGIALTFTQGYRVVRKLELEQFYFIV